MTNKEIIQKVNEGFSEGNTEKIMLYVADDVRWDLPGTFSHVGKEAFRKEVNNDAFEGLPSIVIKNEIAEGDLVVVEGEVKCAKKDGGMLDAFFCDVYHLENEKIKEMRSYLLEKNKSVF